MVYFIPLPPPDERFLRPPPQTATVLIVGSGPAGLFASLLLAKNNIQSVIIEKHAVRTGQPKAHAINPRSLEIFRQVGLDTETLRKLGSSVADAGWVRFVTVLTGPEIASIIYERQDDEAKRLTPEPLFNIPQPVLEDFVQEAALKTGLVTIHRRWEWKGVTFGPDGKPKSLVKNRDTNESVEIASEYVIGADGTESAVRQAMEKLTFDGLPGYSAVRRHYVSIHAKGSIRPRMKEFGDRYAVIYFCMHPKHRNALLIYDLDNSWVYARTRDPIKEPAETFTEARCRELVDGALGEKLPYDLVSANMWYTDPRIASAYADPTLRIFLAGDSAHTFPPTGGLGINTGFGDVHNLCWKLISVLSGKAIHPERLLKSYTAERKPVANANALQSFINQKKQNEDLEPTVKRSLGNISVDDDAGIEKQFGTPEVKAAVQGAIEENKAHFDSLGLQLGYIYGDGDGLTPLEDCSKFVPTARPGARLPHCWISGGRSILDIISTDTFTLLASTNATLGGPVYEVDGKEFTVAIRNVDELGVDEVWKSLCGVNGVKGLLVRPDQHVLGEVSSAADVEPLLREYL